MKASKIRELGEKIEKMFKCYHVNIAIIDWDNLKDRVRYEVKLKSNTRNTDISARALDVQSRLKLPLFQVGVDRFNVYIVASDQEVEYPRLPKVLDSSAYSKTLEKLNLPYIIGHDTMGEVVIVDLVNFPHLLIGGSTNSGKSVGLQSLITSIAYNKSPSEVNFILIDVGAGDLMAFEGLPHLSCPVIRDLASACNTLSAIKAEMERRNSLEYTNSFEFKQLPRLVLAIDEFPALFNGGIDKKASKTLVNTISSLLQRGRHAKIHLVLAAQNPTFHNMKVDLGNVTARIAFKCAKKNFSETILDEGGAENLLGQGNLLLKSPQNSGLQWIQGIYAKPKELRQLVQNIKRRIPSNTEYQFTLTVPANPSEGHMGDMEPPTMRPAAATGPSAQESLLAAVMFWALSQEHLSTNMLMREYHLGWNRAADFVQQLEKLGIVDKLNGKQSRYVRPKSINDLPDEMVQFMEYCDYPRNSLICAFQERRAFP